MADTYPKFYVIHDTGRPVRILSFTSVPEAATPDSGWEPFLDMEALLEDADQIDESDLDAAVDKWLAAA
jgi:hypothetical protein